VAVAEAASGFAAHARFCAHTAAKTTKAFDRQGRLTSVTENDGTTASVKTSYGYDVGSRLSSVSMPGTGGTQSRSFTYDNRGFLTSETHPELGASGYGSASHSEYDSRGHAHRTSTGTGFDVRTAFDAAERPTLVTDMANSRTLKQFAYDSGYACGTGTTCQGKLAAAARYNYDPDLGTVTVTESIQYGGIGSRPSRRDRSVGSSNTGAFSGESFFFAQTYNTLGDLSTLTYPCRSTTAGTCKPADRTPPVVNNGYTNGFLTSVAPSTGAAWASSITYQPTGLASTISHGGGVTETWAADPNGMARPQTISATDSTGATVWSTGTYLYDGAGNIKQIGAASYVYDAFNRLASWNSGPLTGTYALATAFGNKVASLFGACGRERQAVLRRPGLSARGHPRHDEPLPHLQLRRGRQRAQ
jgi:YD repeat-containing protein